MFKKYITFILRWGGAIVVLCLVLRQVHLQELIEALKAVTLESVLLLVLIGVLLVYISALKWSYFVAEFGKKVSVLSLTNLYFVGYFINAFLPSTLGGDALRSWYVGKKTGQHSAFASTILERFTGFLAMVILAFIGAWVTTFVGTEIRLIVTALFLAVVVGMYVVLQPALLKIVSKVPVVKKTQKHVSQVQEGFKLAAKNPSLLAKSMILSFCFHLFAVVNTMAAGWAVGWFDSSFINLAVVVPLALLVGALPITPSGLGLQEGAFYVLLHQVGATPGQALGIAVILRLKTYLLAVIGGFSWLYVKYSSTEGVKLRSS